MLESLVFPVQRHIFARYNQLLDAMTLQAGAQSFGLEQIM